MQKIAKFELKHEWIKVGNYPFSIFNEEDYLVVIKQPTPESFTIARFSMIEGNELFETQSYSGDVDIFVHQNETFI